MLIIKLKTSHCDFTNLWRHFSFGWIPRSTKYYKYFTQ